MSQTKRQWCAMLAKLVAPMDPETAARAFVDMLPMLPADDTLYTRATLDAAATCERKTAVPAFADISTVLGRAAKARLPADVRMGWKPALPAPEFHRESPEEIEACRARNRAIIDQMRAEAAASRPAHERPGPKYLTVLELALTDRAEGRPITRPDKIAALAEYDREARA